MLYIIKKMTKVIDIKEKQKEKERKVALKNLAEAPLMDLATAYFVEKTGQYGEAGSSAIEEFKYFPAMNSGAKVYDFETGKEVNVIQDALLGSRQDDKRYTGSVSEHRIIKSCAKIMEQSLERIKVQDILELIDSDEKVADAYKDKYLSELSPQVTQEEFDKLPENEKKEINKAQEIYGKVMAGYVQYLTGTKVSEALEEKTKAVKGGLEGLLTGTHKADDYELKEAVGY